MFLKPVVVNLADSTKAMAKLLGLGLDRHHKGYSILICVFVVPGLLYENQMYFDVKFTVLTTKISWRYDEKIFAKQI